MGIPEAQLQTWSNQGATVTAAASHRAVRLALDGHTWSPNLDYEVYLQGSYRNFTNVRGDSDVDVVVQLNSVCYDDTSALNQSDQALYKSEIGNASYTFNNFRDDVRQALQNYFGYWKVGSPGKAIRVDRDEHGNRLPVDVVPALRYRKFTSYSRQAKFFVEGIAFQPSGIFMPWIFNFPKLHFENGAKKNDRTGGWFKPTIRVFKNARAAYNEKSFFTVSAPSYFLECLIGQVPDDRFGGTFRDTYQRVVSYLKAVLVDGSYQKLLSQNGQVPIFGSRSDQWSISDARACVDAFSALWDKW